MAVGYYFDVIITTVVGFSLNGEVNKGRMNRAMCENMLDRYGRIEDER